MKATIIRFAELYSAEFLERLSIGSLHGDLTPEEISKARALWNISDSMASVLLVNMQALAVSIHVAALDNETGYFDGQKLQNLTIYLAEKLEDVQELQYIAAETLSVIKRYELEQACSSQAGGRA